MVENKLYRTILTHAILILGIAVVIFPIYITLVAVDPSKKRHCDHRATVVWR